MLKKNPFLLASVIFGSLSLILLIIASVSLVINDTTVCKALTSLLRLNENAINNSTLAQFSIILSIPSFIFAFRA